LRRRGIELPFLPIRDADRELLHSDLAALEELLDRDDGC
jgi:hypothetical protein